MAYIDTQAVQCMTFYICHEFVPKPHEKDQLGLLKNGRLKRGGRFIDGYFIVIVLGIFWNLINRYLAVGGGPLNKGSLDRGSTLYL